MIAEKSALNIDAIRSNFPVLDRKIHGKPLVFLDSAASSQKPLEVIEAVSGYYKHAHANVHRGVYTLSQEATDLYEQARKRTADFIHASDPREVIFTSGATDSINAVAQTLCSGLNTGDEILISAMEHHANIVPWQMMSELYGLVLKIIPVDDAGVLDMEAYRNMLTEKTKVVGIVHVSNTLGTINPVRDIIAEAHEAGALVLVDGSQATPHMPIDVQQIDADFYVFSGHKMYGPTGIGVLYGKGAILDKLPPFKGGGEMIESVTFEKTTYNTLPHRFEAGTPHVAGAVGLHAAIDFIEAIGKQQIAAHEHDLLTYATSKMEDIPGMRLIGTAPDKAAVISFLVDGLHPYDVGTILDKYGIAVRTGHHCTQPLMIQYGIPGTIRASFGVYNTRSEVDYFVDRIEKSIQMLR